MSTIHEQITRLLEDMVRNRVERNAKHQQAAELMRDEKWLDEDHAQLCSQMQILEGRARQSQGVEERVVA